MSDCLYMNSKTIKPMTPERPYTTSTLQATKLLGQLIKLSRKKRRLSESALAERASIARSTLQKIEKGDPSINIGLTFEAASVVGVSLFGSDDPADLNDLNQSVSEKLALLSHKPGRSSRELKENF